MKTVLFYCNSMEQLAKKIAKASRGKIELGEVSWKLFPDGYPDIKIENVKNMVRGRETAFLMSLANPNDIFPQICASYAIPRNLAKSYKLILPFFPTGTMERVDEDGRVATAKGLARMLSVTPHARTGPTELVIYDIHAPAEWFFFSDNVLIDLQGAIPLLKRELKKIKNLLVAIAFPDEGARKRFGNMFDGYPQIVCNKQRSGDKRIITVDEFGLITAKHRHVIIVDDLVMTGGTLIECANVLKDAGAAKVSAFVTHAVFPQNSWTKISPLLFDNFWTTDSCPTSQLLENKRPFKILSLAFSIAKILQS